MSSGFRLVRQHLTLISFTLAIGLMTSCSATKPPGQDVGMRNVAEGAAIEGTAAYRERIALPPNAVFEAVLEDVTIANASATEIARTTIPGPAGPPIRFSIAFDPLRIDPGRTYSVKARILVDETLWFTSDTAYPVLTRGAGRTVDIVLKMVMRAAQERPRTGDPAGTPSLMIGAHGLRLPATFRGDLPCADCQAIRYHLDLWPDQVFHLRREWLGKNLIRDEVGRWRVDPDRQALILRGEGEMPLQFEVKAVNRLRQLDMKGTPIESALPYELVSDGALDPIDPSLPLSGEMVYLADAARFTECLTGRSYSVALEGDFVKMERAYLKDVKAPGARLYVTFEGVITDRPRMEGSGVERSVVVNRFIDARLNQRCERARADASLTNTYWRINSIDGHPVSSTNDRREPYLLLRRGDQRQTYAATIGCNQLVGSYTLAGEGIAFTRAAATLMACPPPLDTLEKRLGEALARTKRWRIKENTLEFLDDTGSQIALLEAVYL
jgi:copper homeostasis protein (lipoprotein)